MIRGKNIQPDTILRMSCREVLIPYPNTQAAYIFAAAAGSTMQSFPVSLTLLETTMRTPHSICVTQSAAAGVFTITFVGENQFGEPITETISTTGASDTIHTMNVFRKLTSATVTAAPNSATTISIGWSVTVGNNGVPKVPLPFKPASLASIKSIAMVNAGTQPTFTKVGAPTSSTSGAWCIQVTAQNLAGNPVGFLCLIVDDDEPNA